MQVLATVAKTLGWGTAGFVAFVVLAGLNAAAGREIGMRPIPHAFFMPAVAFAITVLSRSGWPALLAGLALAGYGLFAYFRLSDSDSIAAGWISRSNLISFAQGAMAVWGGGVAGLLWIRRGASGPGIPSVNG